MTGPQHSTPHNQPGGFPPQQPYGAQPPPQPYGAAQQYPPQYGAPQAYGQPPYPPAPGGHYPPQPGKSGGAAVPLILGGGFVLMVVIGIVAYFLFSGGGIPGTSSSPREVAEAFVNGGENKKDLICKADLAKAEGAPKPSSAPTGVPKVDAKSTLKSVDVPEGSDKGTFTVSVSVKVGGRTNNQNVTYDLVKEDGEWKVCGLLKGLNTGIR
ncbi:hypothetical protein OHB12_02710 [Nocardia sp. NBC_01730]|uniref:Rv0361 family membrane protein n=1 Tax=Nocardia sp. NBC_01730 TaxID=2975998 RepID=UPI002E11CFEA|nr:hypothetical protein OHB12_02710 [Nocardia sp. NBC_01730]